MSTIKNLVDLAVLIEIGGFNFTGLSDKSITRLLSLSEEARKGNIQIKQEPKQIDMTPFIKNGLDCEFSTNKHFHPNPTMNGNMGTLRISQLGGFEGKRFVDVHGISSPYCRPRLNHPFVWSNDLDLPKGLVIEYGHWNQSNELIWGAVSVRFGNKVGRITGCKEGHTFVG